MSVEPLTRDDRNVDPGVINEPVEDGQALDATSLGTPIQRPSSGSGRQFCYLDLDAAETRDWIESLEACWNISGATGHSS
jgi:hypothetical protein